MVPETRRHATTRTTALSVRRRWGHEVADQIDLVPPKVRPLRRRGSSPNSTQMGRPSGCTIASRLCSRVQGAVSRMRSTRETAVASDGTACAVEETLDLLVLRGEESAHRRACETVRERCLRHVRRTRARPESGSARSVGSTARPCGGPSGSRPRNRRSRPARAGWLRCARGWRRFRPVMAASSRCWVMSTSSATAGPHMLGKEWIDARRGPRNCKVIPSIARAAWAHLTTCGSGTGRRWPRP